MPLRAERLWYERLSTKRQDLIAIIFLYAVLLMLFNKIIFSDMIFSESGDNASAQSWTNAISNIEKTEHVEPLWNPYIFSGMPSFGALVFPRMVNYIQDYLLNVLSKVIFFGASLHWMIMPYLVMGCSMYLFARRLSFSPPAALIAALTLMLNPYAVGLPETGHGSKLITLSYIPLLLLLTHMLFQRRNILNLALLSAIVGTMLLAKHPQMAFYGLFVIGCYFLYEVVLDVKTQPVVAMKKAALFAAALILGFAIYAYHYLPTQEYAQYSIRGGGKTDVSGGLSYDYATNWSFHPLEMFNFVIPSFMGIVPKPETWQEANAYWGWMPFTNSYVYIGVVPLFFAIIALIYQRNRLTWFLALLVVMVIFISFGKHFPVVYALMFNYFPFFNKFRIPSMILHVIPIPLGMLAAYGFTYIAGIFHHAKESEILKLKKRLTTLILVMSALLVIGLVFNDTVYSVLSGFMFQKEGEMQQLRQQYGAQASQIVGQLKALRFELLWKDYVKFAIVTGAVLGLVIMYLKRKVQMMSFALGLLAIGVIDLFILDGKYINPKPQAALAEHFQVDATLQNLKAESDTSLFRVFPTGSLDQDNTMMYHLLQSVEGYSPAKLKIYQEVRDSCFTHGNMNVFNMLNVKYLVGQQQAQDGSVQTIIQPNQHYLPRAWFVDSVVISRSKEETFSILNSSNWNPRTTAIIEKELPAPLSKLDSSSAAVTKFNSRSMTIAAYSAKPALLVVSEIYYPAGWKAYVDGTETEIYKTNHILRSVMLPAGTHTIEFMFDPQKYTLGYMITQTSWGLTAFFIVVGLMRIPAVRQRIGMKKREERTA
ncbi:MAG: YfhO family protein [Ignavibacteriae bacterium]|nr:YfhO family protein [Ignavibacteria bacterium]MBI3365759.1 YfhO family protein [Ignavibacteriota bacterium]